MEDEILKILRDQIWQFVGALFGLVALVVSVWVALRSGQKKRLSIVDPLRMSLIRNADKLADRMEVFFDGAPVRDGALAEVTLLNSGTVEILGADFVEPARFSFGEKARILYAEVIESDPANLGASVQIDSGKVILNPLLLNPTESLRLRVIGTGIEWIRLNARIAGIRRIEDFSNVSVGQRVFLFVLPVSAVIALCALALAFQSGFLLGFAAAGVLGFMMQQLYLLRHRLVTRHQ